ncbi:MAG: cell division protein FtsX, partial [Bacteroidales bacterium]|nr:cell division protein FtsX [Bacteroidales bacterium]
NNTIRLSVYARRFLIKSMQLVGATQGYIRRPFVILSIIHGLVSSLIAILLLTGILYLTQTEIPEIIKLQDYKIFLSLFVIMIFLGTLFTGISTFFAVKKYLKINNDKIYY